MSRTQESRWVCLRRHLIEVEPQHTPGVRIRFKRRLSRAAAAKEQSSNQPTQSQASNQRKSRGLQNCDEHAQSCFNVAALSLFQNVWIVAEPLNDLLVLHLVDQLFS